MRIWRAFHSGRNEPGCLSVLEKVFQRWQWVCFGSLFSSWSQLWNVWDGAGCVWQENDGLMVDRPVSYRFVRHSCAGFADFYSIFNMFNTHCWLGGASCVEQRGFAQNLKFLRSLEELGQFFVSTKLMPTQISGEAASFFSQKVKLIGKQSTCYISIKVSPHKGIRCLLALTRNYFFLLFLFICW